MLLLRNMFKWFKYINIYQRYFDFSRMFSNKYTHIFANLITTHCCDILLNPCKLVLFEAYITGTNL